MKEPYKNLSLKSAQCILKRQQKGPNNTKNHGIQDEIISVQDWLIKQGR